MMYVRLVLTVGFVFLAVPAFAGLDDSNSIPVLASFEAQTDSQDATAPIVEKE